MVRSPVYTRIPACDPALLKEAGRYGVSDLHEGLGAVAGRTCLMAPSMRPNTLGTRMVGQAITSFNYPGDNLMLHRALALAEAGQVIVASNGGSAQGALWGELAFPVWSTAVSPSHPEKRGPGAVNMPLVCAGVTVNPGDIIAADGDGVLVISPALLETAVTAARARAAKEEGIRAAITRGETLAGILGMGAAFEKAGIEDVSTTWNAA
jgi:4-hydroxy-4-methyl-2-oxoglutarate aldolase